MNRQKSLYTCESGAILIAALVMVVTIAAVAAISLRGASQNAKTYRENSRKQLSEKTAQSALEKVMGEINNIMKDRDEAGDMHGELFVYNSRDRSHSDGLGPVLIDDPDFQDMVGDTRWDHLQNSEDLVADSQDLDGTRYLGGIYRVSFEEWNDNPSNPSDYGTLHLDEPMETNGKSLPGSRRFSVKIEAAYGNYMTEMWALVGTRPREGFGMFGSNGLSVGNNLSVNSFQSLDDHPYADRHRGNGNIGTSGPLEIGSNTDVYGTAEYGTNYTSKGTVHDTENGEPVELLNKPEEQTYEQNNYTDTKWDFLPSLGDQTYGNQSTGGQTQIPPGRYNQLEVQGEAEILSGPIQADEIVVDGTLSNPNGGEIVVKNDMIIQEDSTFDNTGGDMYIQENYDAGRDVETYLRNPDGASSPLRVEVKGGQGGGQGQGLLFDQSNYMEVDGETHIYSQDLMAGNGFQLVVNSGEYNFEPATLEEEGYVEFQLDGNVEVKPGGGSSKAELATDPVKPPALKMRVGGNVEIYPRGKFSMDLMAPDGTIEISPHSQNDEPLRGRLYADQINMSNNMKFEYDMSLPSIMGHYAYRGSTTVTRRRGGPRP